jgi:hypothetical protein
MLSLCNVELHDSVDNVQILDVSLERLYVADKRAPYRTVPYVGLHVR